METKCDTCPKNTFTISGAADSSSCEARYEGGHSQPGAGYCEQCLTGKYYDEPSNECELCPKNTFTITGLTDSSGCAPCANPGEYAVEGYGYYNVCPQYMEFCKTEQKCVYMASFTRVGDDGDNGTCTCKPGFNLTGETCSACEIGRFKEDNGIHSCSRCEDVLKRSVTTSENLTDASACACPAGKYDNKEGSCVDVLEGVDKLTPSMVLKTLMIMPGAVFFGGLLILFKRMTNGKKGLGKRLKNGGKIIFVAVQIMVKLPSIIPAMSMPANVKEAMKAASFLNVDVFNMVSVGCWAGGVGYYDKTLTLATIGFCALFILIGGLLRKHR
ncbi:hypothetical protein TrLO_g817 [Triparma laevis f. longispina]|uniref:Tyrosine-protein kinase ephrin type A/B receptor-like domain-containing protein n=1 Tax=Triparma laevis f. longispina TaxID=1714387 RepID=A0A9W7EE45_9STRA|nr:hypothetical protein TrLO_g817 [Triparma laevis f. longispina]